MKTLQEQFAEWARAKPADEAYSFMSNNCAVYQFEKAIGLEPYSLNYNYHKLAVSFPRTFGALADRIEARLKAEALQ